MGRAIYMANNLGVDMGMFYKRRDYSTIIDGRNPIVAHEFLGADVKGKDMIIIDDMISVSYTHLSPTMSSITRPSTASAVASCAVATR